MKNKNNYGKICIFCSSMVYLGKEVNKMSINISTIKEELENKVGSRIKLVAQTGRKKQTERHGVLAELYPSVFIVQLDQEENAFERVSYSYTDILTHSVEVLFHDSEEELIG